MNWDDRIEVKKGNIGESLVEQYLTAKGYVVYRPTTGPHPFDRLCASSDKRQIFIAEIKSKPRRKLYPDTGFNWSHYEDYTRISMRHSMDVFVYFVDEVEGWIYGGELFSPGGLSTERLIHHNGRELLYPLKQGAIIYFPLSAMERVAQISDLERRQLAALSTGANAQGSMF